MYKYIFRFQRKKYKRHPASCIQQAARNVPSRIPLNCFASKAISLVASNSGIGAPGQSTEMFFIKKCAVVLDFFRREKNKKRTKILEWKSSQEKKHRTEELYTRKTSLSPKQIKHESVRALGSAYMLWTWRHGDTYQNFVYLYIVLAYFFSILFLCRWVRITWIGFDSATPCMQICVRFCFFVYLPKYTRKKTGTRHSFRESRFWEAGALVCSCVTRHALCYDFCVSNS